MRVLFSATNFKSSVGGGETFALGLASALSSQDGVRLGVAVPRRSAGLIAAHLASGGEILPIARQQGAIRVAEDALLLDVLARRWGADLVHYPHEWAPRVSVPLVLTIQNIAFVHPESESMFGVRGQLLRVLMKRTAHRAAAVGAVSALAGSLWRKISGFPGNVAVIPEGFKDEGPQSPEGEQQPYCLLLTGPYAYKNTDLGVGGFRRARAAGLALDLHIVGERGDDEVGITYHGWVPRGRVIDMIRGARVTMFPSSVEAFGLPALESIAVGTPCIFLRGTAMEEWLGDSGVIADRSVEAFAEALLRVSGAARPRVPMNLDRFDWNGVAADWVNVYQHALRGVAN